MAGGKLTLNDVFAMSVNGSIGAGILAVPWCFLHIGPIAGVIFTIVFYLISTATSLMSVENISLCSSLKKLKKDEIVLPAL